MPIAQSDDNLNFSLLLSLRFGERFNAFKRTQQQAAKQKTKIASVKEDICRDFFHSFRQEFINYCGIFVFDFVIVFGLFCCCHSIWLRLGIGGSDLIRLFALHLSLSKQIRRFGIIKLAASQSYSCNHLFISFYPLAFFAHSFKSARTFLRPFLMRI